MTPTNRRVIGLALLVLIGAPYLAGMAQWWDIMLIAIGLILVAAGGRR